MGLKNTIIDAAKTAFVIVDDLAYAYTYTSVAGASYDAATGIVTPGPDVSVAARFIDEEFAASEIDGTNIQANDKRLLISVLDLPFDPKIEDYITTDGIRWNVIRVSTDPANAHWILQVRK